MEPRAHHVLIGAFTIITVLSGFLFVLWLGSFQIAAQFAYYDVRFREGVSGLSIGSEVRYNGVKVGEVSRLRFEPAEPGVVYVTVRIENRPDFTIRADSLVSLEYLGITGLTYVHIVGGTTNALMLPVVTDIDGERPVIEAQASAIQLLFMGAPEMLAQGQLTLQRINEILSPANLQRIEAILANIESLTANLSGQAGSLTTTLENVSVLSRNLADSSAEFEAVAKDARKLIATTDTLMAGDVKALIGELDRTAESIGGVARLGEAVIAENREAVNAFSGQGLSQLGLFISEARALVATIDRLAGRIETDPAGYLLGGQEGVEFEPKKGAVP